MSYSSIGLFWSGLSTVPEVLHCGNRYAAFYESANEDQRPGDYHNIFRPAETLEICCILPRR